MNTNTNTAVAAAVAAVAAAILNRELGAAIARLTGKTAPERVAQSFTDMLRDPDEGITHEDVARGLRLFNMGVNTRCNEKQRAFDAAVAAVWSNVTLRHDKKNNSVIVVEKKTRTGNGVSPLEQALKIVAAASDSELLAAIRKTGTESVLIDILSAIKPTEAEAEAKAA